MYVIDNLSASEWAKIQPGLHGELQQAYNLPPNKSITELDYENRIDSDIWAETVKGYRFWIRDRDYPPSWTKAEWIDFIVSLAKDPNVTKVGYVGELFGAPYGVGLASIEEGSPAAMFHDIDTKGSQSPAGGSTSGGGSSGGISGDTSSGATSSSSGGQTAKIGGFSTTTIALVVGGGLLLLALMKRR